MLSQDAIKALNLGPPQDNPAGEVVAVVISHDCDLAQDPEVEPEVEVISGRCVAQPNGNYTHGKNPRQLHLVLDGGTAPIWVQLEATRKLGIAKSDLARYRPDASRVLTPATKLILQRWLAARYRRAALPDEFNNRLKSTGLADRIAKIMAKNGAMILAVLFDLDNGMDIIRKNADDPYELTIYLLYSTQVDAVAAAREAESAKPQIEDAFRKACYDAGREQWRQIELIDCIPVSDQALTVAESEKLARWYADHISLRADPSQDMLND